MNKTVMLIIALFAVIIPFAGCSVNPVTGQRQLMLITQSQELQIGQQYAPEIKTQLGGEIENSQLQSYIQTVGSRVSAVGHRPDLEYHFTAVEDNMTNALALPGGYIFITKGMLEKLSTEDQLAAVLAHETAHVTAQHSAQLISRQIGFDLLLSAVNNKRTPETAIQVAQLSTQLLSLKYSRDFERQADQVGTDYLVKAGYNPYAMVEVMQILQQQGSSGNIEFLSTHPSPQNRLQLLTDQINQKNYPSIPRTGKTSYTRNVTANLN